VRSNGENFAISISRLLLLLPEKLPALRLCYDGSIRLVACSDQMNLSPSLKKPASYASWAGGICGRPASKSASGEQVQSPTAIYPLALACPPSNFYNRSWLKTLETCCMNWPFL